VDYYVGQDKPRSVTGRAEPEGILAAPLEKGVGTHLAKSWETAIRQALMPVTPQSSVNEPKVDLPAANGATGRCNFPPSLSRFSFFSTPDDLCTTSLSLSLSLPKLYITWH
jgi:hypothetical protein